MLGKRPQLGRWKTRLPQPSCSLHAHKNVRINVEAFGHDQRPHEACLALNLTTVADDGARVPAANQQTTKLSRQLSATLDFNAVHQQDRARELLYAPRAGSALTPAQREEVRPSSHNIAKRPRHTELMPWEYQWGDTYLLRAWR